MNKLRNYVLFALIILLVSVGSQANAAPMTQAEAVTTQQINEMFVAASSMANPSVVTIASERVVQRRYRSPFSDLWDFNLDPFGQVPEFRSSILGSGVIINATAGYIVTNNHVVQNAEDIEVMLIDRRMVPAEVIGADPRSDVAVIRIDADNLQQVQLGDSDDLRIGEWVLAIGSPFSPNLDHTVTAGIVSAKGRSEVFSGDQYEDYIQTDAAINPGNSGGALVNLEGELVGINTAIATDGSTSSSAGVGFAIPINLVMRVANDLIENGRVIRAFLGVNLNAKNVDAVMARALGMKNTEGAMVFAVQSETPAEKAGIREGDVIIRVDDTPIRDNSHLSVVISSSRPGDRRRITLIRDGKERTLNVSLTELPEEEPLAVRSTSPDEESTVVESRTGFTVEDLDSREAQRYNIRVDEGVLVTGVDPRSKAVRAGIQRGDVIVKVGDQVIKDVRDYDRALDKINEGDAVLFRVVKGNVSLFIGLELN